MGINPSITPQSISHFLFSDEAEYRRKFLPPDRVETILRYGSIVGSAVRHFTTLDRGMDRARKYITKSEQEGVSFSSGSVIVADVLTNGKGRFQRVWHAPDGGLWLTLILVNTHLPETARYLPLVAGIACCEAVRHFGVDAKIKWVNDVHLDGRKIAGILMETFQGPEYGEEYILVGIGLNVNNEHFPPDLANRATSLKSLVGSSVDINHVAMQLLAKLAWNVGMLHHVEEKMLQESGMTGDSPQEVYTKKDNMIFSTWYQLSDTIGRKVLFGFNVETDPQYEAEVLDIDGSGGLILRQFNDDVPIIEQAGEIVYLD